MESPIDKDLEKSISDMNVSESVGSDITNSGQNSTSDDTKKKNTRKRKSNKKSTNEKEGVSPAAITAAHMTFSIGRMLSGPDGEPNKEINEEETMIGAYDAYLKEKGIIDIPPGCALCMVLFIYGVRVLKAEKAKPKLRRALEWIKSKFRKNATQFNNRNDGEWENNPS